MITDIYMRRQIHVHVVKVHNVLLGGDFVYLTALTFLGRENVLQNNTRNSHKGSKYTCSCSHRGTFLERSINVQDSVVHVRYSLRTSARASFRTFFPAQICCIWLNQEWKSSWLSMIGKAMFKVEKCPGLNMKSIYNELGWHSQS